MIREMKPNVFVLVIDSFRADKFYGSTKTSITPNLDKLIKSGVYFTQNISSAYGSIPSTASILTGRFPINILTIGEKNDFKLSSDISTFIQEFQLNGYNTYSLMPEFFKMMGVLDDFENVETYHTEKPTADFYKSIAEKLNIMKKPWLFYVHLMDIHDFRKPLDESFNDSKYGENNYERLISELDSKIGILFGKINFDDTLFTITSDHGTVMGNYTHEMEAIRERLSNYNPKFLYKIINLIVKCTPKQLLPVKDKKLLIRTLKNRIYKKYGKKILKEINKSDFSTYEKRICSNTIHTIYDLYDEKFRIPLFFTGVSIPTDKIIHNQVRNIDIFPTLMEFAKNNISLKNIQGRSLVSLILNDEKKDEPTLLDSCANWTTVYNTNTIGVRTSRYKYFRNKDDSSKDVTLFDLENDPFEVNNISNENKTLIQKMENTIQKYSLDTDKEEKDEEITQEERERIEEELRMLGYL